VDWFKTQTTNEYIKGVKSGLYEPFEKHLWQPGYYEHIIRNQKDLDEIRQYIKNNPVKWVLENKSTANINIKETQK
jgi:REP element-mobilizing transposase RayT